MKQSAVVLSICADLANALLVAWSVATFFLRSGVGNMKVTGFKALMYFTVDSNVLSALASLGVVICLLTQLGENQALLPRWLILCKLVGAAAVGVTFLTVMVFLGPRLGYKAMFAGVNLHLHLICPLLAMISLVFLERSSSLPFPVTLLGILPTVVYGAVYLYQVVITKGWQDFYGFNLGGRWYLSLVIMVLVSWGICAGLWAGNHALQRIPAGT